MNIDIVKFCEDNLGNKREVQVNLSEADFEHVRLAQNRLEAMRYGFLITLDHGLSDSVTITRSPTSFPAFYRERKAISPVPLKEKSKHTPEQTMKYTEARDEMVATINAAIAKFHNETPFDIWALTGHENENGTITSVSVCLRGKK